MEHQNTIKDFFTLLEEKNINAWIELWEDNAICTFPYANQLFDTKLEGKEVIKKFWSGSPDLYDRLKFEILETYHKDSKTVVFFNSSNILKGKTTSYNDLNIGVFTFSENHKILEYQEFFDAINLGQVFNIINVRYLG